jgi:hypothetical protein
MQTTGSAELPLLNDFLNTIRLVGPKATADALARARNKSALIENDPVVKSVITLIIQEMGVISLEDLTSYKAATTKKKNGLIIASYCLLRLKYSQEYISILLSRDRTQIYRYNLLMKNATSGRLHLYKIQFEKIIKSLTKKPQKNKPHGTRKK